MLLELNVPIVKAKFHLSLHPLGTFITSLSETMVTDKVDLVPFKLIGMSHLSAKSSNLRQWIKQFREIIQRKLKIFHQKKVETRLSKAQKALLAPTLSWDISKE